MPKRTWRKLHPTEPTKLGDVGWLRWQRWLRTSEWQPSEKRRGKKRRGR